MHIMTLSEKDNPYMKRREVSATLEHTAGATPSRASLQQMLATEWKVKPEQVDIKAIVTGTGRQSSRIRVHVWHEPCVADLSKVKEATPTPVAVPAA